MFSADSSLAVWRGFVSGRLRYISWFWICQICVEQRGLVDKAVVSGCVPEPVPLAYVTTVLPAAGGGGGGGGLPHHPLPQLRTLRSTWQHALQAALHPPAHGLLRLFPPWCNNPGFEAALSSSPAATHYTWWRHLEQAAHMDNLLGSLRFQVCSCVTLSHHITPWTPCRPTPGTWSIGTVSIGVEHYFGFSSKDWKGRNF